MADIEELHKELVEEVLYTLSVPRRASFALIADDLKLLVAKQNRPVKILVQEAHYMYGEWDEYVTPHGENLQYNKITPLYINGHKALIMEMGGGDDNWGLLKTIEDFNMDDNEEEEEYWDLQQPKKKFRWNDDGPWGCSF